MNDSSQGKNLGNPLVFGILALIAIILIGFFALVALGRDIEQVGYAVGPSLITLLGIVAVLTKADNVLKSNQDQQQSIDDLHDKTDTISKRVNGELDAKFTTLNNRIDDANQSIIGLSNQVKASTITLPSMDIGDAGAKSTSPQNPQAGS